MLGTLQNFLAVDYDRALEFFIDGLIEVTDGRASEDELFYCADVLAYHTQVSCYDEGGHVSCPKTLTCIFDRYMDLKRYTESPGVEIQPELVASQILVMSGFFKSRMEKRHNIDWYRKHGIRFYTLAAELESSDVKKAKLMNQMARNFSFWAESQHWLERVLRDKPYLIDFPIEGKIQ